MKKNPFDNLPEVSKEDAFKLLAKPNDQLELSSDYYKAVFHLYKYPGLDTEKVLLNLLESNSQEPSILIAKRKAIEVLARHGCVNAIPIIGSFLDSSDPYLVENAAWALQELNCKDSSLIQAISNLLSDPNQNRRVLIQALSNLGSISDLPSLKLLLDDLSLHPGIRGASIAAVRKLSGGCNQIKELEDFLKLPNQNDRQCAVNDVINSGDISLLSSVLRTPVAPSFRMKALYNLWPQNQNKIYNLDLINTIDSLIKDNPNHLELLDEHEENQEDKFLVECLLNTDFRRAYLSLKHLSTRNPEYLWGILSIQLARMKRDYGALYFLMILFRSVDGWNEDALSEIKALTFSCLEDDWPDFMKFRPVAILTAMKLFPSIAIRYISKWLDESMTPFWACRYATLLKLDSLLRIAENRVIIQNISIGKKDTHRFVREKAKKLELDMLLR